MFHSKPFRAYFALLFLFSGCIAFLQYEGIKSNADVQHIIPRQKQCNKETISNNQRFATHFPIFSTTKKTDELFQPIFSKIFFNGSNPDVALKQSLEAFKSVVTQSLERDPFAQSLLYLSQFSSDPDSNQLRRYFFSLFSNRYNLTLQEWQQQVSTDLAAMFSPPGWEELSGNVSAFPIVDPWFEIQTRRSNLDLTALSLFGANANSSLVPLLSSYLGHTPRLPVQASLSSAVEDQLKLMLDTEEIQNIVFFNSPVSCLQNMPDNFTVQLGEKLNAETTFFYTTQKKGSLFGSRPFNRATVKIAQKNKLLQVASTTALLARRSSLFQNQLSQNQSMPISKRNWKQELGVDLLDLTSMSVESFIEEVKDYVPLEARAKVKEEYEYTRRRVLTEYEKLKTGLRAELSGFLPSDLMGPFEVEPDIGSSPYPFILPEFNGELNGDELMQPQELAGPDPNWQRSFEILMKQPKIGPAISKERYWTEGKNYPLLLHSSILFSQAPYNLERNRINASVLEEVIADLNDITAGGFLPEKWSRVLTTDAVSKLFPNTQGELKALASKTANATSSLKKIGNLASSLADGSDFPDLLKPPSSSYFDSIRNSASVRQLKDALKDPVLKQLLSTKGYSRIGDVFTNELGGLVAELNTTTLGVLTSPDNPQESPKLFPNTKQEFKAWTKNATSILKKVGSLTLTLANSSDFSGLLKESSTTYFDRLQKDPAFSQLKAAFEDPIFKRLLSTEEYSRIGDVFTRELQNFVAELDVTPELLTASERSLTHLLGVINATATAQVRCLDSQSNVGLLARKALGHQDGDDLEIYSITSDKAVAVFCQDASQNLTVVSFRGTKDSTDVLTDITFLASPITPVIPNYRTDVEEPIHSMDIHRGFGVAFETIEKEVASLLSRWPTNQVLFTGHSMGGALAQIAAVRFSHTEPTLVTFASPAIGNQDFCRYLEKVAHPHGGLRVWNEYDIVPSLAQVVGYTHAGVPIRQMLSEKALANFEKENKKGAIPGFSAIAPHVLFQLGPIEYVFPVLYNNIQPVPQR